MTSSRHQRETPTTRRATTMAQSMALVPTTAWSASAIHRARSSPPSASAFTQAKTATVANTPIRRWLPLIDKGLPSLRESTITSSCHDAVSCPGWVHMPVRQSG